MSWAYRVVQYRDGSGFGLHEVYFDKSGKPWAMTEHPASFVVDADEGPQGILAALILARTAALHRDVFVEPETWPGISPPTRRHRKQEKDEGADEAN